MRATLTRSLTTLARVCLELSLIDTMGATGVSFRSYFVASAVGMLPGTVVYVFIGAVIGSATANSVNDGTGTFDRASCRQDKTLQNVLLGVGAVATVAVLVFVSWKARQEIQSLTQAEGGQEAGGTTVSSGPGSSLERPLVVASASAGTSAPGSKPLV